jgi:hypothetical protein
MRLRLSLLLSVLTVVAGLGFAPAQAAASVPKRFVGMMVDGPFFYPGMDQGAELSSMVASGVESIRTLFDWAAMQPYKSFTTVPSKTRTEFQSVNGVPTRFTATDQLVGLAAIRGLSVLPIVEYAPSWDSRNPGNPASPPASSTPYARFVAALIQRYGPHGSFWAANPSIPRLPIRMWQIWNEPDFTTYWSQQPFESAYVKLLQATRKASKAADSGSKIVLAGLPNFSWQYLAKIYKIKGARGLFDAVAVHPYTATPAGAITILQKVRVVMNANGDRNKPILATEVSWPSAKGKARTKFENATTETGQAQKVGQAVRLLARYRNSLRLDSFYYYTWITNESRGASVDQFNFAGLFRFINGQGTSTKPVFSAFRRAALAVEGK